MATKDPRGSTSAAPKKPAAAPAPKGPAAPPATTLNPLAPPGASAADHANMANSTQPVEKRVRKTLADPAVSVTVHTAYNLTLDHGEVVRYERGVQDMPESHADHFYSKHHIERNE